MSKLPVKLKKQNIFEQFYNYIKKFLKKEKNIGNETIKAKESNMTEKYKVYNIDKINADLIKEVNKKNKMEEIIQIIEKNPEALEKLDIPKLEIIDNYYKERIIEYKRKLGKS